MAQSVQNVVRQKNLMGDKMFDFRRVTVFYLVYRLSNHKTTRYAKNLGGGPLGPPGYAYGPNLSSNFSLRLTFVLQAVA